MINIKSVQIKGRENDTTETKTHSLHPDNKLQNKYLILLIFFFRRN